MLVNLGSSTCYGPTFMAPHLILIPTFPTIIASISTTSSSFYSLFRVLFIFPLRYLFAIGFLSIFSLGCFIPPILNCTLKQFDSFVVSWRPIRFQDIYRGFTLYPRAFLLIFILLPYRF